ncbi:MAG TPA: alpha-glucosidase, partial [Treponema sp.]|nr:alpha-glucosidase [Treponema sp.]
QTEREVYLPQGTWENINDNKSYKGGQRVSVAAPIDCIPVFRRKA